MVTTGENMRMMKRSPGSSSAGCAQDEAHVGGSARAASAAVPSSRRTSASISAVPEWKWTGRAVLEGLRGRQQVEAAIDLRHGVEAAGLAEHVAARQIRRARYRPG